jgi:hypothetical protein
VVGGYAGAAKSGNDVLAEVANHDAPECHKQVEGGKRPTKAACGWGTLADDAQHERPAEEPQNGCAGEEPGTDVDTLPLSQHSTRPRAKEDSGHTGTEPEHDGRCDWDSEQVKESPSKRRLAYRDPKSEYAIHVRT